MGSGGSNVGTDGADDTEAGTGGDAEVVVVDKFLAGVLPLVDPIQFFLNIWKRVVKLRRT